MKSVPELAFDQAMASLYELADPAVLAKMTHFGSHPGQALGISLPKLRALADHHRQSLLVEDAPNALLDRFENYRPPQSDKATWALNLTYPKK